MTFENHLQLRHLSERFGYSVDYVEAPIGFYDRDGYAVDLDSVKVNTITKQVENYERVTKTVRGKKTEFRPKIVDLERAAVLQRAMHRGIENAQWTSTQQLLFRIENSKAKPQATLALQAV